MEDNEIRVEIGEMKSGADFIDGLEQLLIRIAVMDVVFQLIKSTSKYNVKYIGTLFTYTSKWPDVSNDLTLYDTITRCTDVYNKFMK